MELMTASRQNTLAACPRKHFYAYEIVMKPIKEPAAFRFGHAWHDAMQARSNGASLIDALVAGTAGAGPDFPEDVAGMFAGLLQAYYEQYGPHDPWVVVVTEQKFEHRIKGIGRWKAAGKIDQAGSENGVDVFIEEHKTTGEPIEPDSPFWSRLKHNVQLLTYADALSTPERVITEAMYDVVKKPTMKRKMVATLDENGLKVVMFVATGLRVFNKDGVSPRQSGGEGMVMQETIETVEAYAERVRADIMSRPGFFFQRRDVPILSDTLNAFHSERVNAIKLIRFFRKLERCGPTERDERAWPRNCSGVQCRGCSYAGPCLEDRPVDLNSPPEGFKIVSAHEELTETPVVEEGAPE